MNKFTTCCLTFLFMSASIKSVFADAVADSLRPGILVWCYKTDQKASNFDNPKLDELVTFRITEQLGLADWRANYSFLPKNTQSYVFMKGYINIEQTQSYVFKLQSVDAANLYIDGKLVIDNNSAHDFKDKDGEVYLQKGLHKIEIKAFSPGLAREFREVSLAWRTPGTEDVFDWVPQHLFYCSKKQSINAVKNVSASENDVVRKDTSVENSLHPSFDIYSLHDTTFTPKVGGMDFLPDGRLVITSWDENGQIFIIDGVTGENVDPKKTKVKRIAWGLAEPLGIKVVDGKIFVLQKQELTQLIDLDGDDVIDEYRTICNKWGATGNFHEFAFGLVYKDGFFYATLATAINSGGKSTIPQNKDRGKAVKIGMDGSYEIVASGLRTPNGIGIGIDNEIFIADNQGDWLPACKILRLQKDAFYGSYSVNLYEIGKYEDTPPVVWLPQGEIGNSASQPTYINVGPYKGQMIHGEVTHGGIKRVAIEKVKGVYQGAAFNFTQGIEAGVNRLVWGPDGMLYVGGIGSSGNWGQTGKKNHGLEKLRYNGKVTFEILAIRAKANGMEVEFTEPLDAKQGNSTNDYVVEQWRYVPTMQYGGPKVDPEDLMIKSVSVSANRKTVFLELNNMKEGHVVFVRTNGDFKSKTGQKIWVDKGWYTLNKIPAEKGIVTAKATSKPSPTQSGKSSAVPPKATADPYRILNPAEEKTAILQGQKLVDPSGCLACHSIDQKILGPSFKMVAAKYKSDPETLKKLTEKVYKGGSGVWGEQAMGAQSHLKKEDITKMVRYVLSLK